MAHTRDSILKLVQDQQVEYISLQFTDILGMLKNVIIPVAQLADCLDHGVWFDGSSIEGLSRRQIAENDMFLVPDLSTYAVIPWDVEAGFITARMICDIYTPDRKPFAGDPRGMLKRALAEAEAMGLRYMVAPEIEFFLFKTDGSGRPLLDPHDRAGYFDISTDLATYIRRRMVRALHAFDIDVEATHHEVEVGQHEIDLKYAPALQAADSIVTFRTTLKSVAQQHNLYATFMPKPFAGLSGNGMHTHQSMWSIKNEKNLFFDAEDVYNLSPLARHFVAGMLAHARGMCAVLAPLVNSYKRLVPGYEAPVSLTWGRTNRSALVRVPRVRPQRAQATRVELRCPDPTCNPYLALAVMLRAGLDGIKNELPLSKPAEEDLYLVDRNNFGQLPTSLGEAIQELQRDEVVGAALGPHILERYVDAKTNEWNEYCMFVSQWELDRYLPTH